MLNPFRLVGLLALLESTVLATESSFALNRPGDRNATEYQNTTRCVEQQAVSIKIGTIDLTVPVAGCSSGDE